MKRQNCFLPLVLLTLLAHASTARATFLPVGGTVVPSETAVLNLEPVADQIVVNVSFGNTQAVFSELAYRKDPNNPFGPSGLVFYLQVGIQPTATTGNVTRITLPMLTGWKTDVGYQGNGPSYVPPSTVSRGLDGSVSFNFPPPNDVKPGFY